MALYARQYANFLLNNKRYTEENVIDIDDCGFLGNNASKSGGGLYLDPNYDTDRLYDEEAARRRRLYSNKYNSAFSYRNMNNRRLLSEEEEEEQEERSHAHARPLMLNDKELSKPNYLRTERWLKKITNYMIETAGYALGDSKNIVGGASRAHTDSIVSSLNGLSRLRESKNHHNHESKCK